MSGGVQRAVETLSKLKDNQGIFIGTEMKTFSKDTAPTLAITGTTELSVNNTGTLKSALKIINVPFIIALALLFIGVNSFSNNVHSAVHPSVAAYDLAESGKIHKTNNLDIVKEGMVILSRDSYVKTNLIHSDQCVVILAYDKRTNQKVLAHISPWKTDFDLFSAEEIKSYVSNLKAVLKDNGIDLTGSIVNVMYTNNHTLRDMLVPILKQSFSVEEFPFNDVAISLEISPAGLIKVWGYEERSRHIVGTFSICTDGKLLSGIRIESIAYLDVSRSI